MVSKKQKTSPISLNQKIDYKDIDLLDYLWQNKENYAPSSWNNSTTT
jgi:ribosomal protein S18